MLQVLDQPKKQRAQRFPFMATEQSEILSPTEKRKGEKDGGEGWPRQLMILLCISRPVFQDRLDLLQPKLLSANSFSESFDFSYTTMATCGYPWRPVCLNKAFSNTQHIPSSHLLATHMVPEALASYKPCFIPVCVSPILLLRLGFNDNSCVFLIITASSKRLC